MKPITKHSDKCFEAIQILRQLLEEVDDPDCANAGAAVRAAMDARKLLYGNQEQGAAPKAPGEGQGRLLGPQSPGSHGQGYAITGAPPGAGGLAADPITSS